MGRIQGPRIFRLLLPAKDLSASKRFYEVLLGIRGRPVAGGRIYFDCGEVILGVLDSSRTDQPPSSAPTEAVYFSTDDLDGLHRRATKLDCLSPELIHGDPANPAGQVVVRPWGERSFYAFDPSGNPLCFVDELTRFTGTPSQVAKLAGHGVRRGQARPRRATAR
jgi:catechol 2,3-dioxygenase-like lactoylglutathione lyase family enzyme